MKSMSENVRAGTVAPHWSSKRLFRLLTGLLLTAGLMACAGAEDVAPTTKDDYLGEFTIPDYNAWVGDSVFVAAKAVTTSTAILYFLAEDLHVRWTSSNPAVFVVTQNGKETTQFPLLRIVGPGQATLSAVVDDPRINSQSLVTGGQATITVSAPGTMRVTPRSMTIPIGETRNFSVGFVTTTGATAINPRYIFDFSVSNANMATVVPADPTNPADPTVATVKALGAGSIRMIVRAFDKSDKAKLFRVYFEDTVSVTIPAPVVPTRVTVTPNLGSMFVGGTKQISAQVFDQSNNVITVPVTWISTDTTIAKVSSSGLVTATGTGTSTSAIGLITARAAAGVEAGASLTIYKQVASVVIDPNPKTLQIGGEHVFTAALKDNGGATIPAAATGITWSMVDQAVAKVDQNGKATGMAVGATKLKATTTEGVSGTSDITVEAVPLATIVRIVVTPANVTLNLSDTKCQFSAKAFDANGNEVQVSGFRWLIDDSTLGSVDSNGLVTFNTKGNKGTTAVRAFYGNAADAPNGSGSLTLK